MMIANKEWDNNIVEKAEQHILKKEEIEAGFDTHLTICDEGFYNFTDFIFTIAKEYKYEEDITDLIDEIYDVVDRINRKKRFIYFFEMNFEDMMQVYEEYKKTPLAIQRKAKIKYCKI